MSRIYVVTDTTTNWKTLVEADSQQQAVAAVIDGRYVAKAATSTEVADLMASETVFLRPNKKSTKQLDLPEIAPTPAAAVVEPESTQEAVAA